ncbi:MAG TPA: CHAT domain-containing protein [Blastocatellia bacterium]|nr:CHAT domain-containing protein [Blastocatellia bacterium]
MCNATPSAQKDISGTLQKAGKDIRPLEPGEPVVRELAGGEAHAYQLLVAKGQYLSVEVEQKGIDIVVMHFVPSDTHFTKVERLNSNHVELIPAMQLIKVDRLNSNHGVELLSTVIKMPEAYRLIVHSEERDVPTGRYEIKIKELRAATPQDESRVAAEKASAKGEVLSDKQARMQMALEKYEEHLRLSRESGDRKQEAAALRRLGQTYERIGEMQKALNHLNQALLIYQDLGGHPGEADTLYSLGTVSLKSGEDKKASDYFDQAISAMKITGDVEERLDQLMSISAAYRIDKQPEKYIEYLQQALELSRDLSNRQNEYMNMILTGLEVMYTSLGDYQSAANYGTRARAVFRTLVQGHTDLRDRHLIAADEADAQAGILLSEQSRDSHVKAIEKLEEALKLYKEAGNRIEEKRVLNDIAGAYMYLGEYKKSVEYLEQNLLVSQALADRSGEASSLVKIGEAYLELGDKQKAMDYANRSLLAFRAFDESTNRPYSSQPYALKFIARIWFDMGDKRKAHEYWDQAISHYRTHPLAYYWESEMLLEIGRAYMSVKGFEEALKYFNQLLDIRRSEKNELAEISVRSDIARLELKRGNPIGARSQMEFIITVVESFRSNIISQDLRVSYFSSVRKYYELYIDILMRLHKEQPAEGHDATALQASERARARSLVELLIEARADIRQGADAVLVRRERSLRDLINTIDKDLLMSGGKLTKEQAAEAAKELESLVSQYQQVRAQIKANSPRYAALTQPQSLSLKEIQQSVLDPDTSLLEYSLGDERSYLWLVTQSSIQSYELPKRSDVEAAARRVYELLTARQPVAGRTFAEHLKRIAKADAEFQMASMTLSKMLLGPASSQLRTKRLLIVADGALQFVPFAALPVSTSVKNASPLMFEHEIVSLPSASALAVLRRDTAGREHAGKAIAVLADPVFDREDPRVRLREELKRPALKKSSRMTDLERAMRDVALLDSRGNLSRLPFSREEAEAILAVVPKGQAFKATDFKASKAILEGPEMSQHGIVHFATHALLNSKHPELSGIVLSLVDEQGRAQDGFLRLHDIYNLNLAAELVVLSACQTALGKEVKGEGLLGLTRGFMYSGAKQVMASLWKVDDGATAVFMRDFYQGIFRRGLKPAAALRAAQIEMRKKRQWRSPYYWAAFVLQGEYR